VELWSGSPDTSTKPAIPRAGGRTAETVAAKRATKKPESESVSLTILSSDAVVSALKGIEILTHSPTDNAPSANAKRVAFESLKRNSLV